MKLAQIGEVFMKKSAKISLFQYYMKKEKCKKFSKLLNRGNIGLI